MADTKSPSTTNDEGPAVDDPRAVTAFLTERARDSAGGRRMFRLPVMLRFDGPGKLMIEAAAVGVDDAALGAAGLQVDLDDSAMSVGLLDRCRALCARDAASCAVWIDAHWGRNLPLPPLPPIPGEPPRPAQALAVRAVVELVAAGTAPSAARVRVIP